MAGRCDENRNELDEKQQQETEQLWNEAEFQKEVARFENSGILEKLNYDPIRVQAYMDRFTAAILKEINSTNEKLP